MYRYIGIPLLAGGLAAGILTVGYMCFLGPSRTVGEFLPDRSRITAVTVSLDAHDDQPEIAAFDIPDGHRRSFLNTLYRARLVCWDYCATSHPNDDGELVLKPVGLIRLFGWGELKTDWGENFIMKHLEVYRLASRSNRLCFVFREFPPSGHDRWSLFAVDLEDAIRRAHAAATSER